MDRRREDANSKLMKFSDFPSSDVLIEILARLPSSGAAIRLKLVCKNWSSLISSHYFITLFNHRRHHLSLPPPIHPSLSGCFIYHSSRYWCLKMVRWGYTQNHDSDLSFLPCPKNSVKLNASCDDLILCSTIPSTFPRLEPLFHYVCNPLTKQWVVLPPATQFNVRNFAISTGFLCVPAPCSLCTTEGHNNNNNFMVVRILVVTSSIRSQFNFRAELFLSEEGKWKSVVVSSPRPIRKWFRNRSSPTLIPYKGMLHWLISGFVLVYDPYNCPKTFCRVIDMPPINPTYMIAGERKELRCQTLGLFQDSLCVTEYYWPSIRVEDHVYYIWLLEDYNTGEWSMVHKLCLRTNPPPRALPDDPSYPLHLDPEIKETGFFYIEGGALYCTNSSGKEVASGIVHWITDQRWPTPVPPITACTVQSK